MRLPAHWLITLLMLLPLPMSAQILEGARIRLLLPERAAQEDAPWRRGMLLRGTVARMASDTLYLRVEGVAAALPIPVAAIRTAWQSRGVPGRPVSAIRRAFTTAILTALVVGVTYDADRWSYGVSERQRAFLVGAEVGALVGAAHGALFPTERWRRIRLAP